MSDFKNTVMTESEAAVGYFKAHHLALGALVGILIGWVIGHFWL